MTYYPTLDEDIARAKEILSKGKVDADTITGLGILPDHFTFTGGTIYGADTYAAYKLLESFVEVIENGDQAIVKLTGNARVRELRDLFVLYRDAPDLKHGNQTEARIIRKTLNVVVTEIEKRL